jgi:hypothetical protein
MLTTTFLYLYIFFVSRSDGFRCGTIEPSTFESYISEANEVASKVDEHLVPSLFSRVEHGFMYVEVDEDDGEANGGASNTDGSYGRYLFDAADVLPAGVCDVPSFNGQARCSVMDKTGGLMLGPADAIVFIGCTPPPVRYFSFDFDIVTRFDDDGYPFFPGVNFGDTVNIRTIRTGGAAGMDIDPYNQPVVVIHTADGETANVISSAYVSSGNMTSSSITLHSLDSSTIRTWNRKGGQSWEVSKPDILEPLVRLSIPMAGYEEQYKMYKKMLWPVRFYFKDDNMEAKDPLIPELRSRYSDEVTDETVTLIDSFRDLEKSIINQYETKLGLSYRTTLEVNYTVAGFYDDWDTILAMETNDTFVLGDRDALYGLPVEFPHTIATADMLFQKGTHAVVIGVQHVDVIGAAYNSVGVDIVSANGTIFTSQWTIDYDMDGSAYRFISSNPQFESFFAIDYKPPGECSGAPFCIEFDYEDLQFDEHKLFMWIWERVYCLEKTQVGPAYDKTIGARLLIFD